MSVFLQKMALEIHDIILIIIIIECFHAIVCGDYYFNQLFPSHVRQLNILITEVDIHATDMKHDFY